MIDELLANNATFAASLATVTLITEGWPHLVLGLAFVALAGVHVAQRRHTVARLVVYDNRAHRASAVDEKTVLTLKATKKPISWPLIAGVSGLLVVIVLLALLAIGLSTFLMLADRRRKKR